MSDSAQGAWSDSIAPGLLAQIDQVEMHATDYVDNVIKAYIKLTKTNPNPPKTLSAVQFYRIIKNAKELDFVFLSFIVAEMVQRIARAEDDE